MEFNIDDLVTEDKHKIKDTKPIGRPKKDSTEKRSYKIMINLTNAEYEKIIHKAKETGISAAVYVRLAALNNSDSKL